MQQRKLPNAFREWRLASQIAIEAERSLAEEWVQYFYGSGSRPSESDEMRVVKLRVVARALYLAAMEEVEDLSREASRVVSAPRATHRVRRFPPCDALPD